MFEEFDPILTDEDFKLFRIIRDYVLAPLLIAILAFVLWSQVGMISFLTLVFLVAASTYLIRNQRQNRAKRREQSLLAEGSDSNEVVIRSDRLHWMSVGVPVIVVITVVGMRQIIATIDDAELYELVSAVVLGLFTIVTLVLLWIRWNNWIETVRSNTTKEDVIRTAVYVAAVPCLVWVLGLVLSAEHNISFSWIGEVFIWLGGQMVATAEFLVSSPENAMVFFIALSVIKLGASLFVWSISKLTLTETRLMYGWKFFSFDNVMSTKINRITDVERRKWFPAGFVTTKVETAGQDQAITDLPWTPVEFYHQLVRYWTQVSKQEIDQAS